MTTRIVAPDQFVEGRWRNGLGVSWDIAAEPGAQGGSSFAWRLAIARIDRDVPFSHYPGIERVFTLIEGEGLDLDVAGSGTLAVRQRFVPHRFAGDVSTQCRLLAGPCRALNLFLDREALEAHLRVVKVCDGTAKGSPTLFFTLRGMALVDGLELAEGAAAISESVSWETATGLLFVAELHRRHVP